MTAAVLLAAGAGSRFSGSGSGSGSPHKLLAALPDGTTVAGRSIATALAAVAAGPLIDVLLVVTGACPLHLPAGAVEVANPRWSEGQATSLAAAIDHARALGHDAVVVGLADQPLVPVDAWLAVAGSVERPIATATFGGRRRPPVRLAAEVWDLLPGTGDEGARSLVASHPHLVAEVPCPGDPADVDTVADLAATGRAIAWGREQEPADGDTL